MCTERVIRGDDLNEVIAEIVQILWEYRADEVVDLLIQENDGADLCGLSTLELLAFGYVFGAKDMMSEILSGRLSLELKRKK